MRQIFGCVMQQVLHRLTTYQVLLHDIFSVLRLGEAVPDIVGIHDADSSMFALVHAAGFQHTDPALQTGILYQILQFILQFLCALVPARGPGCVGVALIHADQNLPLGNTHGFNATRRSG
ncbi:hypothetical protein SAMN05443244_0029 [Terriglobus roseus]|uniref:Uncharacterized protein n=1 Tax=Terriglobus roseus TaxID=392734 RepID=A0A1H4ISB9_9BACT|nr:hypothetical protein SAMN05443244_0029 [Terriglobus roseus]